MQDKVLIRDVSSRITLRWNNITRILNVPQCLSYSAGCNKAVSPLTGKAQKTEKKSVKEARGMETDLESEFKCVSPTF